MKRHRDTIRKGALIFLILSAVINGVYADGYRNPPPTAEGIAKSGANMIFVDDASAISYNPANLAFQTDASIVVSATFARQETTFKSATTGVSADSDGDWTTLPNLFFSMPAGDSGVVFGLGISTPFGQGIDYRKSDLMNIGAFTNGLPPAIHSAEISLINFNPTVAFKLGDNVAIGIGADVFYSELTFKQFYPWSAFGPTPFPPFLSLPDQSGEVEADGYGFGGNAGITWNITDGQRLAFTYRSEVKVEYEGDLKVTPPGVPGLQLVNSDFDLDIKYPTVLGLGYGIALTDTIRIEANLEWLEWSVNDTQTADLGPINPPVSAPQNWDNTFTVGVGGDWQFADGWVARAGYAFIETPIPDETIAPVLPDADRHALSLGLGYAIGGHAIDVAYTFSIYEDRDTTTSAYPGTYDIDSDLVGLTYSYSF